MGEEEGEVGVGGVGEAGDEVRDELHGPRLPLQTFPTRALEKTQDGLATLSLQRACRLQISVVRKGKMDITQRKGTVGLSWTNRSTAGIIPCN